MDYFFVSSELLPFCYSSTIKTIGFSDHRAVTAHFDFATFKRGPGTYKFNTQILYNKDFVRDVKNEISDISRMDLNPHQKWEYIKIAIKNLGMAYGRYLATSRVNNKNKLIFQIDEVEKFLSKSPDNLDAQKMYTNLKQQLEIIVISETEGARVRSGQKWAEEGEKCTKFFLNLEKQRSNNNTIFKLVNNDTKKVSTTHDDILTDVANHFKTLYTNQKVNVVKIKEDAAIFLNPNNAIQVSEEDNELLNKHISENDLLMALKNSNNSSAPGIDGLPGEVYKFFWVDLKIHLLNSINYSFETGYLCTSQCQGVICLLHKGKCSIREEITNWRPLSLTNFDYKLIAKVLARRLIPILEKIIDHDQHAFIKGRNISNMLREIDDIIELGKAENLRNIILSIDYAKAFDTLSSDSILHALKYFDIGSDFIKWIKILLSNRMSCVRNGGYLSYFFNMERGVRQGCPISPLLFILTSELFARNIRNDDNIRGINIAGFSRPIKIRQFADDTTLFLRDLVDYREVLSKIKRFANFTGLHLNKNKSFAMHIADPSQNNKIKFGIRFVNKLRILGITFSNMEKVNDINENFILKIEQLKRLCSLWSKRKLSIIGKITILKSFGLSLFIYIMQSIGIPEEKLKEINNICFRFLWKRNFDDKRAHERVKRNTLYLDKKNGGLNMFNIYDIQHSFYLHWADRLLSPINEKWKAIPKILFDRVGGNSAFQSNITSKFFKGIDLITNSFWKRILCTWLDRKHLLNSSDDEIHINSCLFNNSLITYKNETIFIPRCCKKSIVNISDVIINGEIMNLEQFKIRFGSRSDTILSYNIIFNALRKHFETLKKLNSADAHNCTVSGPTDVGSTSRRKYLCLIQKTESPYVENKWARIYQHEFNKTAWLIPYFCTKETRLRILQWKIMHGIYPSGILLKKMKIKDSELCQFCNIMDTIEHFFYECKSVLKVWKEIEKIITKMTNKVLSLDSESVLLGVTHSDKINKRDTNTINLLILVGKHAISKYKYGTYPNLTLLLEQELTNRKLL